MPLTSLASWSTAIQNSETSVALCSRIGLTGLKGACALIIMRRTAISTIVLLALLPASLAVLDVVEVSVDASGGGDHFVHKWKRSFGSGHAQLTLRDDWRAQASQAADELGMGGVRFHGMFGDDMGPVVTAPGVYNFTLIESTWDFLHAAGIKPVVELSFMPAVLANCAWHGHCVKNPVGCQGYSCWRGDCKTVGGTPGFPPVVNPTAPACHAKEFHYQGLGRSHCTLNLTALSSSLTAPSSSLCTELL